ncbi:MAG TPA: coenzyme F420-reducing hydrogenase, FrhD protein [Methanosarcina sp.]|nr:coenzyme F420-reducing hydrogenase, FrhD protein [Methanosarcina sp.]
MKRMETLYSEIVVAGCGNPLYADDGFGPAVVEGLKEIELPENVTVVDAGLGGPHFIFTLLNPESTKALIIVDIADFGGKPGELRWLGVDELPAGSYRDAHSWDLTEPLQLIKDDIRIRVLACQKKYVSDPEMVIGITDEVQRAIPGAISEILKEIGMNYGTA